MKHKQGDAANLWYDEGDDMFVNSMSEVSVKSASLP